MRSIWKHKWVIVPIAVAIILAAGAVGAVALADPEGQNITTQSRPATVTTAAATTQVATQSTAAAQPGQALRERLKARIQQRLETLKQRWTQARTKMSPDDQKSFDQLLQTAKDQQAALQKARQDLRATLKQMQDLVKKYRLQTTTTS
jgi:hypothetical protein